MTRVVNLAGFIAFALLPALTHGAQFATYGADDTPWRKILGSVGIEKANVSTSRAADVEIEVLGTNATEDAAALAERHFVILEGDSPAARKLGFTAKQETVLIRRICDEHAPQMRIIWEKPVSISAVDVPTGFQVFAKEESKGVPVVAGKRMAHGAILWIATSPGETGIERYPYLLQALSDLGLPLPLQSTTLWAFFDSSYRIRADADYLAKRWRRAGIGALHVAAWHNMDPDPVQDAYLQKLIEACHRNAILVYAWLELPHVSEKFWADHPEWREKTALNQDAQLDWRKLMNLQNPDCRAAAAKEINNLLARFDWDGVNIAELYFESLEGASNPARFTPMNDDVRRQFENMGGFDPKLLFDPSSQFYAAKNPAALRKFLDYRAWLASQMQAEWLNAIDRTRASKPYLDIVLTHIDDRFDPGIRDELGADVARSLPLIQAKHSTLLIEDPATLWNLGPDRYAKLAEKYHELTPNRSDLAVDINVVERYQDVYPTKKQTGTELFELVHQAAASFGRVALYFENSLEKQDLTLLPVAATTAELSGNGIDEIDIKSQETTRIAWQGPAEIDGRLWPVQNSRSVLAPAGMHRLTPGFEAPPITIADFNGEIQSALSSQGRVDLSYTSRSRAIALLGSPASSIDVDGEPFNKPTCDDAHVVMLPPGQHLVTFKK